MTSIRLRSLNHAAVAALAVVPALAAPAPGDDPVLETQRPERARVEREAWAMGTRVRILVEAPGADEAGSAAEVALREIERIERVLSTWDAGSELGRLNEAPVGERWPLSRELAGLLSEAFTWAERTGRAFDPTVGALVDAWDIRGEGRAPSDVELTAARAALGPLALGVEGRHALRRSASAWIDAGAFGKGAALRSVSELQAVSRADRMLVDLGGQLWAHAPPEAP